MSQSKYRAGAFINSLSSSERKEVALSRGLFAYFPDALALIARHSVRSNEKHNPGQAPHWSREKSTDHEDCIGRHSLSIAIDPDSLDDGQPHIVCRAWRALAALQLWAEREEAAPAGETTADVLRRVPKDEGWIEWGGGECPTDSRAVVQIRFPDKTESAGCEVAGRLRWGWAGTGGDIIAYRIVDGVQRH